MPVLIIDDTVRGKIRKVIEYAVKHPTSKEDMLEICAGKKFAVGYNEGHSLIISGHYRVVYSQEYQIDDKKYHHLSISVPGRYEGDIPSREAVEMIMQEFGMGDNLMDCRSKWLEDNAVNLIKKI